MSTFSNNRGTLKDFLSTADAFARLADQANRLQRLQSLLDAALPAYLSPGARIANLKRGKVVIHADSGAVAVKLRQLAPRLAEGFIQQGQEVIGIEVRVQPRRRLSTSPRQKPPKILGERPKQALTSLASGLEEGSPIRLAVEKLLKNA
ncbi:MAG: DciA family protein [Rhodocyclaceae bacterium]|nr:DciA family protein [Rhodocyclaceae bacterium]MDP1956675.1 DciA family protein [Rhodocyclaceae bacterium]